jgi:hypothetical protein
LIKQTTLRVSIIELDGGVTTECHLGASNVVTFIDGSGA